MLFVMAILVYAIGYAVMHFAMRVRVKGVEVSPIENKGLIVVYRNRFVGALLKSEVRLNGHLIGRMRSFNLLCLVVEPGVQLLSGNSVGGSARHVSVNAGEIAYVEQQYAGGECEYIVRSEAQGRKDIKACKSLPCESTL
jgi:hypothetical protein